MNWKKIFLIFVVFLTFLGTGTMLSNVQSREADQLLEAHGLSNNTRYFRTKSKESVRDFLKYINHQYPKNKIQIHFDNQKSKDQVLFWANRNLISLPTESGRFFSLDDFSGQVSFAVLGPNVKVKILERQGNKYLFNGDRYYSVIGTLKNYHQIEQNQYYLSTGINQPTAGNSLNQYRIVIDSSNKVIHKIARKYKGKLKTPEFVKYHQIHRFSVVKEILLIILFWLIAMLSNILIAIMQWKQVKLTHLSGSLLRNWLVNRGIRLILIEGLLEVIAYAFLRWQEFFKRTDHLIMLLVINWLVAVIAYLFVWIYRNRKEKKHAEITR